MPHHLGSGLGAWALSLEPWGRQEHFQNRNSAPKICTALSETPDGVGCYFFCEVDFSSKIIVLMLSDKFCQWCASRARSFKVRRSITTRVDGWHGCGYLSCSTESQATWAKKCDGGISPPRWFARQIKKSVFKKYTAQSCGNDGKIRTSTAQALVSLLMVIKSSIEVHAV